MIEQQVRRSARVFTLCATAFSACVMKPRLTMIELQVLRRARVFVLSATAFSACVMKPLSAQINYVDELQRSKYCAAAGANRLNMRPRERELRAARDLRGLLLLSLRASSSHYPPSTTRRTRARCRGNLPRDAALRARTTSCALQTKCLKPLLCSCCNELRRIHMLQDAHVQTAPIH